MNHEGGIYVLSAVLLSAAVVFITPVLVGEINVIAVESGTNVSEENRVVFFSMADDVIASVLIGAAAILGLARPLLERGLDLRSKARRIKSLSSMLRSDDEAIAIIKELF